MSTLTAASSAPSDLLPVALSSTRAAAVSSRPDESFWKDVFDQAETLGMATADAAAQVPPESSETGGAPVAQLVVNQAGQDALSGQGGAVVHKGPSPQGALALLPHSAEARTSSAPARTWAPAPASPVAARWQAQQGYGLAPSAEPVAVPPSASTAQQAPSAVNATLVTMPNGELKLYLRAAGLSAHQAIEAAALTDLPWAPGQAPATIAEVVLNGQTIYTRGADAAPSFILTC